MLKCDKCGADLKLHGLQTMARIEYMHIQGKFAVANIKQEYDICCGKCGEPLDDDVVSTLEFIDMV